MSPGLRLDAPADLAGRRKELLLFEAAAEACLSSSGEQEGPSGVSWPDPGSFYIFASFNLYNHSFNLN